MNLSPPSAVLLRDMDANANATKTCPFCAEPVQARATICPHCRSSLGGPSGREAYRNRPGRLAAGVSVALAEAFDVSVTFVRLAFIRAHLRKLRRADHLFGALGASAR